MFKKLFYRGRTVKIKNDLEINVPCECIVGGASVTNKTTEDANQDAIVLVRNNSRNFNAVAIADGIGGLRFGGEAARITVSAAEKFLSSRTSLGLGEIFFRTQLTLRCEARRLAEDELDQFGTTFIVAVETKDHILIGYVGNGSVWHVRGNFMKCCDEKRNIPWCATNLLNPHSILIEGREVLHRFLSAETFYEPTIIQIFKDSKEGDVIIITSDGLSSADQSQIGCDGNGDQWVRADIWLPSLLSTLRIGLQNGAMSSAIQNFLFDKKQRRELDDDTTVAALISEKAVRTIMQNEKEK